MARGLLRAQRGGTGGIAGLLELIDGEHREAIEYTLIELGLRLRWLDSEDLTVRDLLVIIRQSPLESALNRSVRGDAAGYMTGEYLLLGIFNQLRNISWQTGHEMGEKPPEPILAPGQENPNETKTVGDVMTIEEMDARLAPYLPRRADEPS